MIKTLSEGSPTARQMAAAESPPLLSLLWEQGRKELDDKIIDGLMTAAEKERAPAAQKDIVAALLHALLHDYRARRFDRALKISALFRRQQWERHALLETRPREAREALHKVGNDLLEIIEKDVVSEDAAARDAADRLLRDLGEAAVPFYVEAVKHSPELRVRRLYGEKLKNYPEAAELHLAAEFHIKNATPALMNLIGLLPDFLSPRILDALSPFAYFPDPAFRHEILRMITRIPGEKTDHVILKYLDDENEPIRLDAVRATGERRIKDAVAQLVMLLRNKKSDLVEEVCIALGKIEDERAVVPLSQLLKKEMFGAHVEEIVRVRAAWALTRIPVFAAKQMLSSLRQDENPMVRELASK
jgi:HEAT repeat protein